MQKPHVSQLLSESSCHMSDAIKADGTGNFWSAIEHYSAVVEKLDLAIKNITDKEALSIHTDRRTSATKRIEMLREQYVDCS